MDISAIDYYNAIIEGLGIIDVQPKNVNIRFDTTPVSNAFRIQQYEPDRNLILHFDYVDGCHWLESDVELPLVENEYSGYPTTIFFSNPCKVVTNDSITTAVYICATSYQPNNDGTHCHLEGWVEMPKKFENWSFIEKLFRDENINVIRWHYVTRKDCLKQ